MRPFRPIPPALRLAACGLTLAACGRSQPTPTPAPTSEFASQQLAVLEEVRQVIIDDYLYADFGGVDWEAETAAVRHRVEAGLSDEQFGRALSDLVSTLPAGSAGYVSRAERIASELEASVVYEGIGAFVALRGDPDPRVLLLSVIEGSPAAQAGLKAHDAVYAVDGVPVTAEEGLEIIDRVRGAAGTEVALQVASPSGEFREVRVRRAQVTASDTLKGGLLTPTIAYVLTPVVADASLLESLAGLLQSSEEQEQPFSGLVLDLRIAGSGGQWPLVELLTLLGDGQMGHFLSRVGNQPIAISGVAVANSQTVPLVILIGPDTSGAPEIFAAALHASGRATLVGMPTAGAIVSFRRDTLSDGSLLTFADSSYVTADGNDLNLSGLIPDVLVEADWDEVEPGADPVARAAVELLVSEQAD